MDEAETIYAGIPGGPELLTWFGRVPTFHDAEIVSITLSRRAPGTLSIHAWNMTREVDPKGYFILDRHAVVTFTLGDIMDVQLDGFSPQNVISRLQIRRAPVRPDRQSYDAFRSSPQDYEIELEPCYGLNGRIRCKHVAISFVPAKPSDVVK